MLPRRSRSCDVALPPKRIRPARSLPHAARAAIALIVTTLTAATSARAARTMPISDGHWIEAPQASSQLSPDFNNSDWVGVVTFTKTLDDKQTSDEPVMGRIDQAINRVKKTYTRAYRYEGQLVFRGTTKQSNIKARVSVKDDEHEHGEQRIWDSCHAFNDDHFFVDTSTDDRTLDGAITGPPESFDLHVDESGGTYAFSFRFPRAKATWHHEAHVRHTGYCQPRNNEPSDVVQGDVTMIDGEIVHIDDGKLDPKKPDEIEGTKTWDTSSAAIKSFVYTITWRFTRRPEKILITDMHFEHPIFPNWDDWQRVEMPNGTIDGNLVRVKTTVVNFSSEKKDLVLNLYRTFLGDRYNQGHPDEAMSNGSLWFSLEPGEQKELTYEWNTTGYAWFNDFTDLDGTAGARPCALQRIRADVLEKGKKHDTRTEKLEVAPRPIIALHGVWGSSMVFEPGYQNWMTEKWGYNWRLFPIGEQPGIAVMKMGKVTTDEPAASITENAVQVDNWVKYARKKMNAWHVDMVAHNAGGLVARRYIQNYMPNCPDNIPVVEHLCMLGTPNNGSYMADILTAGAPVFGAKVNAMRELTGAEVAKFNRQVGNRRGVLFSALAGNAQPLPAFNGEPSGSDGMVSAASATFGVSDSVTVSDMSVDLLTVKNFIQFVQPRVALNRQHAWAEMASINELGAPVANGHDDYVVRFTNATMEDSVRSSAVIRVAEDTSTPTMPPASATSPTPFFKEVKIAPGKALDVSIPVTPAASFGVMFIAAPEVSAKLTDNKSATVGQYLRGDPHGNELCRSFITNKPITAPARWRLKLQNGGSEEAVVLVAAWPIGSEAESSAPPVAMIGNGRDAFAAIALASGF